MSQGPILVVDDDPNQVELVRGLLVERGYEVMTALDGKGALALATARRPALILLDLIMPVMTGYEFLRHLWALDHLEDVPVVVVSGAHVRNPGGTIGFLRKPIDVAELLRLCAPFRPQPARAAAAASR